ncbi:MAG: nitroreductase family protein [Firmicutes bacterium]|nr:nitroreductase family protein [Bacillota bacterium]
MDAILTRRSIRKYTSQPVSEDAVNELLEAAMSAPSAGNQQPWHFIVINDRGVLDEVPTVHPYSQMMKEASVAILVCADLNLDKHKGYWVQDCSAATENILIAAQTKGLGAVWLGIYPREDRVNGIKKLLNIPENVIPLSLIPVGYPAEHKPRADRFDRSRVHYNHW